MDILPKKILIKELFDGYEDNDEEGVFGYGGKLDIRPRYQREWIYDDKKRNAVIDTVQKGHPLNSIYWAVREDGNFEVIDGQQRIISICRYLSNDFAINGIYFHSLREKKEQILNYPLTVYFCSGTDEEKLEWFETINIAGEELTPQELKNAVYSGSWVTDAKRYFSKTGCLAYNIAADYFSGRRNRQEYLEEIIKWRSEGKIKQYMSKHQHDTDANDLKNYFVNVIDWIEKTFIKKRASIMKGLPWGTFYNKYKDKPFNSEDVEKTISHLIKFEDYIKIKGIYEFILTGDPKHLSPRTFSDKVKQKVYEMQNGKCKTCGKSFDISEMEADHKKPWFDGGETVKENCQMLCRPHHYEKTATQTKILKERLKIN